MDLLIILFVLFIFWFMGWPRQWLISLFGYGPNNNKLR